MAGSLPPEMNLPHSASELYQNFAPDTTFSPPLVDAAPPGDTSSDYEPDGKFVVKAVCVGIKIPYREPKHLSI